MQIYTLPDGTQVHANDQFQIGNQKYPRGWLLTAPAADIAAAGITVTTVPDPVQPPPPPAPPAPPTAVQLTSSSTPALNGSYGIDPTSTSLINAEMTYIQETTTQGSAKFTNGGVTKAWVDTTGAPHTFTISEFIAFAMAVAQYVDSLITAEQAGAAFPTPAISIP